MYLSQDNNNRFVHLVHSGYPDSLNQQLLNSKPNCNNVIFAIIKVFNSFSLSSRVCGCKPFDGLRQCHKTRPQLLSVYVLPWLLVTTVCMYVYVAESPLDLCRLDYKRMPCLFSWADVLWSCTITYQAASIWLIRVDARVFLAQRDWDADQCSGKCRFVRYATPTRHSFVAWPLLVAASRNCSNWLRSLYWKCKVG